MKQLLPGVVPVESNSPINTPLLWTKIIVSSTQVKLDCVASVLEENKYSSMMHPSADVLSIIKAALFVPPISTPPFCVTVAPLRINYFVKYVINQKWLFVSRCCGHYFLPSFFLLTNFLGRRARDHFSTRVTLHQHWGTTMCLTFEGQLLQASMQVPVKPIVLEGSPR